MLSFVTEVMRGKKPGQGARHYEALDWLLPPQGAIEAALASRYLGEGSLVLDDVFSTYLEGHAIRCPATDIRATSGAAFLSASTCKSRV